jgi:MFS family permease
MAFVTLTFSMLYVLVPLAGVDLGASPVTVGLLVSSGHVLPMLLAMRLGRLADQIGARRILTFGAIGALLMPLAFVVTPGLPSLALTQLVSGLFHVCLAIASQSLVASLGHDRTHERNFAWYMTFLSVGQLGGPVAAGVLVDTYGYQVAFASLMVTSTIALILVGLIRRLAIVDIAPAGDRSTHGTGHIRRIGSNVGVQLAVLGSCGVLTAIAVRQAFMPVYLLENAFSATSIGVLLSLRALAAVAVRPMMPRIIRLLGGRARALVVMVVLVALGVGALGFTTSFVVLAGLSLLAGIGTGIGMPLSIVTIASHVEPHERATALALRLTVNRGAQLVTPFLIGAAIGLLGYGASFFITGGLLIIVAIFILRLAPVFDRSERIMAPQDSVGGTPERG